MFQTLFNILVPEKSRKKGETSQHKPTKSNVQTLQSPTHDLKQESPKPKVELAEDVAAQDPNQNLYKSKESLMPFLTCLTDENISEYVQICSFLRNKSVKGSDSVLLSQYCISCSQIILNDVSKHISMARHKNTVGSFCIHCNMFIVSIRELGFEDHLKSDRHHSLMKYQGKNIMVSADDRRKLTNTILEMTDKKPEEQQVVEEVEETPSPPSESLKVEIGKPPLDPKPQNLMKYQGKNIMVSADDRRKLTNTILEMTDKKPEEQKVVEEVEETPSPLSESLKVEIGKPPLDPKPQNYKTTFYFQGLRKGLKLADIYNVMKTYGQLSALFYNEHEGAAYATFCPLLINHIECNELGDRVQISRPRKPEQILRELSGNIYWEQWNNLGITPECKKVFSFKRIWEQHMENVMRKSIDVHQNFEGLKVYVKKNLKSTLGQRYKGCGVSFYGPLVTGLISEDDFLRVYLSGLPDGINILAVLQIFQICKGKSYQVVIQKKGDSQLMFVVLTQANLKFTIDTENYLHLESSLMIRTYVNLDERVKWLLLTVKEWWRLNDIQKTSVFFSDENILEWLVLCFLMTKENPLIPPAQLFFELGCDSSELSEGQMNYFSTDINLINECFPPSTSDWTNSRFLIEFFYFYTREINLYHFIFLPYSGEIFSRKEYFISFPNNELEKHPFIILHPSDANCNILHNFTKEDLHIFLKKIEATIVHMINC